MILGQPSTCSEDIIFGEMILIKLGIKIEVEKGEAIKNHKLKKPLMF